MKDKKFKDTKGILKVKDYSAKIISFSIFSLLIFSFFFSVFSLLLGLHALVFIFYVLMLFWRSVICILLLDIFSFIIFSNFRD